MKSCEELMMDSLRVSEIKLTMKSGAWNLIEWKKRRGKGVRHDHKDTCVFVKIPRLICTAVKRIIKW